MWSLRLNKDKELEHSSTAWEGKRVWKIAHLHVEWLLDPPCWLSFSVTKRSQVSCLNCKIKPPREGWSSKRVKDWSWCSLIQLLFFLTFPELSLVTLNLWASQVIELQVCTTTPSLSSTGNGRNPGFVDHGRQALYQLNYIPSPLFIYFDDVAIQSSHSEII